MMRSLWTSASGMTSQQLNVDTISNNLANVNTTGYKKERMEFKSLLYETMGHAEINEDGQGRPVALQVGHGVRPIASTVNFSQGGIERTENNLDFAIDGKGFFAVRGIDGEEYYTRDGSFKASVLNDEIMITTSEGYPILGMDDEPILLDNNIDLDRLEVGEDGSFRYMNLEGEVEELDTAFKMVQFNNVGGLEKTGSNLYRNTSASGEPIVESENDNIRNSRIIGRSLEVSNVQVVEEMVKLIVAQRAYEVSSKGIQTSDDMLAQANQLKR
ncbi:flagellar basal-body rod protein FlgG [Natranaerovirga hydrolytica]|uniref:Flagellar basal-body rod protein FlgG n=1 Tax=Natranaerovirga hydrolytica TaxID=680378 RepID=A0A4R1MKL0_9FIRM|nr:flagellar hook-basal body protein [Natranaerovirga hydrolytica]TCK93368.1 flagellar basal-body rod protein FlgG [Natranaerovirga hydrolytica]